MNDTLREGYAADVGVLVFGQRRTGAPALEPGQRGRLCAALESILANVGDFDNHYALLNRHYHGEFPFTDTLSDEQAEAVLREGLRALDDMALARLTLNPVALYSLSEQITGQYPRTWWDVLRREGVRKRHEPETGEFLSLGDGEPEPGSAWLGTVPLPQPVKPALLPRRMVWEWEVSAVDCVWQAGERQKVAGQKAKITAEWSAGGSLAVTAEGFLSPGEGQTLEVAWLQLAGGKQFEGKSEKSAEPAWVRGGDAGPPRSGDRLKLRHLRRPVPDSEAAWDLNLVVAF